MIIAIDGPAASGKGTLAKRLAAHYGFKHLDSGLLYRGVARTVLDAGKSAADKNAAIDAARTFDPGRYEENLLKGDDVAGTCPAAGRRCCRAGRGRRGRTAGERGRDERDGE